MTPGERPAPDWPPGLPPEPFTAYLAGHADDVRAALGDDAAQPLLDGPLRATLVPGGRSNLTYLVTGGSEDAERTTVVVRRPPLGHVLATAHDMGREHRVIGALHGRVPVPRPVLLCQDTQVIGAPFYVMEYVAGTVFRHGSQVAALPDADRVRLGEAMLDVLAGLHALDPEAAGLADFGRPQGFLARQVRRWTTQLAGSRSRDLPGLEQLASRLAADVPDSRRVSVVHGDYRLDNMIVDSADPGRVLAVLDWEMATLGDPLADLGLLVVYRSGLSRLGDAVSDAMDCPGFPDADALTARYAAATGADLSRLPWYVGFGYFKLAVILEGIHYRYTLGQTVGEGFDRIGPLVPPLADQGLAALAG